MKHKKTLIKKCLLVFYSLLFMIVVTGCGAVHHKVDFKDKYIPPADTMIELGRVMNKTGEEFDIDIKKMLSDSLEKTLKEKELLWSNTGGPRLLLESNIIDYRKGDAFKRWLLPGWGATILIVQCDLVDDDNKIVGSVKATRTVSMGGLYSVGAWKTVFDNLANDVVEDLSKSILASKDRKPDRECQKEYKSEVNYQRPIEETEKNNLAYIPQTSSQFHKESGFKLAILPWKLVNNRTYTDSETTIIAETEYALKKVIEADQIFIPEFSYYDLKKIKTKKISDEILNKTLNDNLWIRKNAASSFTPNIDLICDIGEKLHVDTILTYYIYVGSYSEPIDVDAFLINVNTKKIYHERSSGISSPYNVTLEFQMATNKVYDAYKKEYKHRVNTQQIKESGFKLAIFPGLLNNSSTQWISDKEVTAYIKDALNKAINSNQLLVPKFSYYDLKDIRSEKISDDILNKDVNSHLWSKESSSTSSEPNIGLICQLGEKLQVDAILTYYTHAYNDSHELFGDFTVSLINVRTKKTYSEKQTCSIRWKLDQDLNKVIKKLYINFEKDSMGTINED
jgi:hypothetical protein